MHDGEKFPFNQNTKQPRYPLQKTRLFWLQFDDNEI